MKNIRKIFLAGIILSIMLIGCSNSSVSSETDEKEEYEVSEAAKKVEAFENKEYYFKTEGAYLAVYDGNKYSPVYLNGMNLGSAKPGTYPGELGITEEEYLEWFKQIADMNCNTIRVYTVMKPEFYDAFYKYNRSCEKPLYLFQGIWYNEEQIAETQDAYDIYDEAYKDACDLVDIFHGNGSIEQKPGKGYGEYKSDISKYVMAWILGIESDASFVKGTEEKHADETVYEGEYLKTTEDASPYETFMCRLADDVIGYEMKNYGMQRPVSWCNWPTADMMKHPK